jgi:uncharacterized damage-inducible protein DinB
MLKQVLSTRWNDAAEKIVKAAEEFPADQYDAKPTADVRSMAEQLRHVAFWNQWLRDTLLGKSPNGDANELPADQYGSKKSIVTALKKSFADVEAAIAGANGKLDSAFADNVITFVEHNGNHYGQMAMTYRVNRLVPPASR